jgi:DNA-binding NtrC family response regulator
LLFCDWCGDIPELVHAFIARTNKHRDRAIDGISEEALEMLVAYDWPGNVRQLENTLERMVVMRSEGQIDVADLPSKVLKANPAGAYSAWTPKLPVDGVDLAKAVEIFENSLIMQALERTTHNKNRAAALLRLNRTTLVEKLKRRHLVADSKKGRLPRAT